MIDPLTIYAISVTAYGIYQKTQNTRLRREIERLILIIEKLNDRISELEDELERIKFYQLIQMRKIKKVVRKVVNERNYYKNELERVSIEGVDSPLKAAAKWLRRNNIIDL